MSWPISMPNAAGARGPASVRIRMVSTRGLTRSPFSGRVQSYAWPGAEWLEADVELPFMKRADAAEWIGGFLALLNDGEGSFLMGDPAYSTPRGIATGTPLVRGADQTGKVLVTDGWTASKTGILKPDDKFQLGSGATARLHLCTGTPNSDGSGIATFNIFPPLRESPADNAAITVTSPQGRWMLASPQSDYVVNLGRTYSVRFSCIEDLRPL